MPSWMSVSTNIGRQMAASTSGMSMASLTREPKRHRIARPVAATTVAMIMPRRRPPPMKPLRPSWSPRSAYSGTKRCAAEARPALDRWPMSSTQTHTET